jgi:alpha/beta superfamily hydrolase
MTESVTFSSTDGLKLVAALDRADDPRGTLVLCHPHPQLGGTMEAPLLLAIKDEVVGRGHTVLRFNFRGLGGSEGRSTTGEAEVADAAGAVAYLRSLGDELPIAIAGWSFGGAVAIRLAAQADTVRTCVAIAPAVTRKAGVAAGLPPAREMQLSVPVLVACGSNDDIIPPDACREWAAGADKVTFEEVPGANHFFWGKYDDAAAIVGDWLDGS